MLVESLNSHLELQRYKILFMSGSYFLILSRLDRNFIQLGVLGFYILSANDHTGRNIIHTFLIIEHDSLLYEDATEMVEYVAQGIEADITMRGDHPALLARSRPSS